MSCDNPLRCRCACKHCLEVFDDFPPGGSAGGLPVIRRKLREKLVNLLINRLRQFM